MDKKWKVTYYNELDAEFGYDPGSITLYDGLDSSVAKSIARGLNKRCPEFVSYHAEPEKPIIYLGMPDRY